MMFFAKTAAASVTIFINTPIQLESNAAILAIT
jgi:hypothetical protein